MSQGDVERLRRLYALGAQGDFGKASEMFDPLVEFSRIMDEVPGGPGGAGSWRGIDAMWQALLDWGRHWDEIRHEAEEFIDLHDGRVLVLSRQTARGKLSQVPVRTELADIFTLRDGKIVRWELYWSRAEALEAVGLRE